MSTKHTSPLQIGVYPMRHKATVACEANGKRVVLQELSYQEAARLLYAGRELLALARRVMADHRAQLPSEARDLYGGGCGCPQCEQARAAIAKAEGRS